MGSLIELLASKKKVAAPSESLVVLPVVQKEHEGACGPNCNCAAEEEGGGCCGG